MLESAYEKVEVSDSASEDFGCSGRFEILKVLGHHEGVRTVISNFLQIATCLRRKPKHLLKFLRRELGIQGEIKGERLILSRRLASKDINAKIKKYAKTYVLCGKCGKPDSELDEDGGKVFLRCLACGSKEEVHKI